MMEKSGLKTIKIIDSEEIIEGGHWSEFIRLEASDEIILKKIRRQSVPLGSISRSKQGFIPYRLTSLQKRFGEEKGKEIKEKRPWHSKVPFDRDNSRELRGCDVSRYSINWSGWNVKYGKWVSSYVDPKYFTGPRIVVREITGPPPRCLFAAYTDETFVHNPGILNLLLDSDEYSLHYTLAILNSPLISYYFRKVAPKSGKGLFPKIIIRDLREIPIRISNRDTQQTIGEACRKLIQLKDNLDKKIDSSLSFLSAELQLKKISNKLRMFYKLDSDDFFKELKKAGISGKKHFKDLKGKESILQWFMEKKSNFQNLEQDIFLLDKKIDRMVYDLYDINEDEIGIIENNILKFQ